MPRDGSSLDGGRRVRTRCALLHRANALASVQKATRRRKYNAPDRDFNAHDTTADSHTNAYSDSNPNADTNTHSDAYTDSNSDTDAHSDPYAHTDAHSTTDDTSADCHDSSTRRDNSCARRHHVAADFYFTRDFFAIARHFVASNYHNYAITRDQYDSTGNDTFGLRYHTTGNDFVASIS